MPVVDDIDVLVGAVAGCPQWRRDRPASDGVRLQDHEDNRILDLVAGAGALLVVSDDADLTSMSPWRGTPILRPPEFGGDGGLDAPPSTPLSLTAKQGRGSDTSARHALVVLASAGILP